MMATTSPEVEFEYTGRETVPKNVTKVVFHPSVTEVDDHAFDSCYQLKVVVLNEGLRKIGKHAFNNCKSLEIIKFPSTLSVIGYRAFYNCSNLREVVLNEGLQEIFMSAFAQCTSLESIKFPSTLSEVGDYAFCNCRNLREVVLNEGLQIIGSGAFYSCRSLERIKFPSTLSKAGDSSFSYCNNLSEVVLNEGLQKIAENAFNSCASLEHFKFACISNRLRAISQDGQREVVNKTNELHGVEMVGGEFVITHAAMNAENWETTRKSLGRIIGLIAYYELKEATTIFELALWKGNIDNNLVGKSVKRAMIGENRVANIDHRKACLTEVPGPAKKAVLQYFSYNRGW